MIEISGLTKAYDRQNAVDGLTLKIASGKVFGFLGPNGAGKTTTMKMLTGLAIPDAGSVSIAGAGISDARTREKIGFMPESPYFYERLTGLEFLRFCGRLFREAPRKTEDDYAKILERAGIAEAGKRKIQTYSKGMKQRLGFAQALVNDPDYLFLDEPLDGLDPIGRREMKEMIKSLRKQGKTIFFNSHILFDTEELCDEIGIIHKGRLRYAGPIADFCKGKDLETRFIEEIERADL